MEMTDKLKVFEEELRHELRQDILPFWLHRMVDEAHGGFYGRMTGENELVPDAEKGAILNARILWTFSSAYRLFGEPAYAQAAQRARDYIIRHFYDPEFGGIFWSVDRDGHPLDMKKQFYAIGFAIYGLSEYYRAARDQEALDYAVRLFRDIEQHSFDSVHNGYLEAAARDWSPLADMRLSEKDENESKTMNTHLHILEGYLGLYRVWKDAQLERQLRNLISLFTDKILDRNGHLNLFFEDDWRNKYAIRSYGHDIEASWLLYEAAEVLGDDNVLKALQPVIRKIAAAADEGLQPDHSLIYEYNVRTGAVDRQRQWWVEAECVVGHFNLFRLFGSREDLEKALATWTFIRSRLIDREHGEWFWSVDDAGVPDKKDDKAGFWKCPYHNGRMCMQILEWLKQA